MALAVTKLNGALGARIDGIDFRKNLTDAIFEQLQTALAEHHVVCIPANQMSPEQHLQMASYFGEPEHHVFFPNLGEHLKYVTVLDSEQIPPANSWHSDEQFLERPPIFTFTHAQQLPSYGGDTSFASLCAAYDDLSEGMKEYLSGVKAVHDYAMIMELKWQKVRGDSVDMAKPLANSQNVELPLVQIHQPSGRKVLFASPTYTRFITGVPALESRTILNFLYEHFQKPEFQYRHRWQQGDMIIWDNRSTLHYAAGDYDQRRVMHRISVLAEE